MPIQTVIFVETFEIGGDSLLGPVGQEHHGGQVGPSRVSTQVNASGMGQRREMNVSAVSPEHQLRLKESQAVGSGDAARG